MRPLRPACGTVSNAQLLTLPATIRISAPGVVTTQLSSLPPASSSATEVAGSSERRLATAQPPERPPTTTKSTLSISFVPPRFAFGHKAGPFWNFWQERQGEAPDPAKSLVLANLAVTKSSKVTSRPFPKQARVGTYPPATRGHCQGLPSQEASGRKRRLKALARAVSAVGFR